VEGSPLHLPTQLPSLPSQLSPLPRQAQDSPSEARSSWRAGERPTLLAWLAEGTGHTAKPGHWLPGAPWASLDS
jgi:hypothetical protein